jgi:hypothetical protein
MVEGASGRDPASRMRRKVHNAVDENEEEL